MHETTSKYVCVKWETLYYLVKGIKQSNCYCLGISIQSQYSFVLHSSGSLINKRPCIASHSNLIYPCQVCSFVATNHKLNPAFKWNIFYEHSPRVLKNVLCLHVTASCIYAYWLTRQPFTWRSFLLHCASSSTKCIIQFVTCYST